MGVFHYFKIAQMIKNRAMHHISMKETNAKNNLRQKAKPMLKNNLDFI